MEIRIQGHSRTVLTYEPILDEALQVVHRRCGFDGAGRRSALRRLKRRTRPRGAARKYVPAPSIRSISAAPRLRLSPFGVFQVQQAQTAADVFGNPDYDHNDYDRQSGHRAGCSDGDTADRTGIHRTVLTAVTNLGGGGGGDTGGSGGVRPPFIRPVRSPFLPPPEPPF